MCGIFGSNNKTSFFDLYQLNRSRGSYSSGFFCYRNSTSVVFKTNEELTINDIPDNMDYYLGHNRAPTSETDVFSERTCHPFQSRFYWYAHNGIINNYKTLASRYNLHFDVDSEWIGYYLDHTLHERDALKEISSNPFAVWIAERSRPRAFTLARVANPIYRSKDRVSFSSAQFEDSELLKEGTIYRWHDSKIIDTLDTFSYKTPYFIPG